MQFNKKFCILILFLQERSAKYQYLHCDKRAKAGPVHNKK